MIDFAILFSVWICKESKYIFFLNVVAYHSHQGRGTPLCSSFQERRSRGRNAEIFSSASCKNSSQAPYHVPLNLLMVWGEISFNSLDFTWYAISLVENWLIF